MFYTADFYSALIHHITHWKQSRELRFSSPVAFSQGSLRQRDRRPIKAQTRSQTSSSSSNYTGMREQASLWFPEGVVARMQPDTKEFNRWKSSDSHLRQHAEKGGEMTRRTITRRRGEEAMKATAGGAETNKNANDSKPGRDDKGIKRKNTNKMSSEMFLK